MNNSKYIIFNVVTLISLIVASHSVSYARKTSFEVDQKESKVGFMVKHKITKDVYGGFRNVEGNVTFDKEQNSIVNVEAKIDVNSIDTGNSKRDRHLKSPDFFDANNFPFIIFKSSGFLANFLENCLLKRFILLPLAGKILKSSAGFSFAAAPLIKPSS